MHAQQDSNFGPYGVPSAALLARASRGYAHFLDQMTEDQEQVHHADSGAGQDALPNRRPALDVHRREAATEGGS
ncbi:hypothetical protein [Streptomyces sp. NPDC085659]|uniref:hypothetical protein n=1 Tax=Streptomyces sp. NPDC085659 TaxID=3155177 RepID=UPI00344FC8DD